MKQYIAINQDQDPIIGSFSEIARQLNISRQAVHKAYQKNRKCKGYTIEFYFNSFNKRKSRIDKYREAIVLLERAGLIIDENNKELSENGLYSNIGIVHDIDLFLKYQ